MLATAATISAASAGPRDAKRRARQSLFLASILFSPIAASLLILKAAPAPFFRVLLTWGAVLFVTIFRIHGIWLRPILFNLGRGGGPRSR